MGHFDMSAQKYPKGSFEIQRVVASTGMPAHFADRKSNKISGRAHAVKLVLLRCPFSGNL